MKVNELSNKGLKREYSVVVGADEIEAKMNAELEKVKSTIKLPGFRPGKAPLSLLKKMHGNSLMGQVLEETVNSTTAKVFEEKNLKPAMQPNVEIVKFDEGGDLEYTVSIEVLPEVSVPDFSKIKLERLVADVSDKEVEEAIGRLSEGQKRFEAASKATKAKEGDAVFIDYVGRIDGEAFPGGTGEQFQLELGSGMFIPGFEEQLIGNKAGDEVQVTVKFPADYHSDDLAGKETVFEVIVHEVRKPAKVEIDDQFAKDMGLESLDSLKEMVKSQIEMEYGNLSRSITKRRLLDALADMVSFEVPEGMLDAEFAQIWNQIKMDAIRSGEATAEDFEGKDGPDDKKEAAEFRSIAERRVRLGLLLSEAGQANDVQVSQEEVSKQVMQEAQRYPGQEQEVFKYFQSNPEAMAQLRAPIFEEKVCDLIISLASVKEKKATKDQLEAALKALDAADEPKKKPAAKKAAPKKAAPKAAEKKAPAKKAAAKKPAAKKAAK